MAVLNLYIRGTGDGEGIKYKTWQSADCDRHLEWPGIRVQDMPLPWVGVANTSLVIRLSPPKIEVVKKFYTE